MVWCIEAGRFELALNNSRKIIEMRKYNFKAIYIVLTLLVSAPMFAGNPQRAGSAGAPEVLINPFARSAGWGDANVGGIKGLEGMFMNVAGLAHTENTEVIFANTQWLVGSGIAINNFGFAQRVGSGGVLGLNVASFDYGEWEITTENQPEGTNATIAPSSLIIGMAYSQKFSQAIFGGINIKLYSTNISNLRTNGVCFDAGVQYIPEKADEWKFGITLRNVGPALSYQGDGLSVVLPVPTNGVAYSQTFESRSSKFELPTQLLLGVSYDFRFQEMHRLTVAGAFTSNSFEKDVYNLGLEYGFKTIFMVRVGYRMFDNRFDSQSTSAITGFTGGITAELPLNKSGNKTFGIDYSYRSTNPFNGIHGIGVHLNL